MDEDLIVLVWILFFYHYTRVSIEFATLYWLPLFILVRRELRGRR